MNFYSVAKILNTHGLAGELKVQAITDFPDQRFSPKTVLHLETSPELNLTVSEARPFKQFWLVKFAEVTTIEQASKLKGQVLTISEQDQGDLPAGQYFFHEILGCQVIDFVSKQEIGQITAIEQPGANDIWEITKPSGKKFWIPYIKSVVKKVDVSQKQVEVELMEGLDDEN